MTHHSPDSAYAISNDIRDASEDDEANKYHFQTKSPENWSFEGMTFIDCIFEGLEFYNCKFDKTVFENCKFIKTTFNQCSLTKASFTECHIDEREQNDLSFLSTKLNGSTFAKCYLPSIVVKKSSLVGVSMVQSNFNNAGFYSCIFATKIKGAYINGLTANKTMLQNTMLNNNDLSGLMFEDCTLTSSDLSECTFVDTIFRDCVLNNANLRLSNLHGLTLERAQVFEVDFTTCASVTGLKISKDLTEQMLATFGVSIS